MELEISNVCKRFAGLAALDDVSMRISTGEIVAVIGPNGSGKTTLMNVVSGVIKPNEGDVSMGGRSLAGLPSHRVARAGVARTFQNIRLFRDMTVEQNVAVAAAWSRRTRGPRRARRAVDAALALTNLQDQSERIVSTLAYGIQRRVEMARAVVTRPDFLLLDEPAAGLNEGESQALLAMIREFREQIGCGVLLVDHDLRLVMRASERIHVLNQGKTLAEGTPRTIREDPMVREAYLGTEATYDDD